MVPIKVLVVEDEMIIAENICDNLTALGYLPLEPAINFTEAISRIEEENPDIAILDIQLSGKKTGIDLAKEIQKTYDFPFIFLTSHADALTINEVKQTTPPAYLIKPFTKDELYSSIEISIHNYAQKIGRIEKDNSSHLVIKDAFFLKQKGTLIKVNFKEILFFRSSHVYIEIILKNGEELVLRSSLNNILDSLSNKFIRIHRGYVVNVEYLEEIDNSSIKIKEYSLPIGRKFKEDILKKIMLV
ncbi:response regulator [uncultured Maribacter sp.]|uniref:response regulator n=1 Tax=uncultured Maribacter sp. TaxID=431308 RepID=UPI0026330066|nr:response regulator [uncultured Maribacter sp.]